MLEKILKRIPFKNTLLAASFFGLASCGDIINNNNYQCQKNEIRETYSENINTLNVGLCKPQIERCVEGKFILVQEEIIPKTEICDGLDNNCDGQTDETSCIPECSELSCIPRTSPKYECGDLTWYPEIFQTDGVFNGYFVVGENAQPIDNLSMTDIATNMWYEKPNPENPNEGELALVHVVDATKLDTEIEDSGAQNLIVIGGPCVNAISAELLGNPANCTESFSPGKARVIMLRNKETNNLAMIAAGYSGNETRLAAQVIAHRYGELSGCELEISGTSYSDAEIQVKNKGDPYLGSPNAQVTITEFGDYQCPFSKQFNDNILPLISSNYIENNLVRFVFKDLPLPFHPHAQKAAEAAECAREQGMFWVYRSTLFDNQNSINEENMKSWAETLGLNTVNFNQCYDSGKYKSLVLTDVAKAEELNITGTPSFFINNSIIVGAQPYSFFEQKIEEELGR